jgi:hypothetical protein
VYATNEHAGREAAVGERHAVRGMGADPPLWYPADTGRAAERRNVGAAALAFQRGASDLYACRISSSELRKGAAPIVPARAYRGRRGSPITEASNLSAYTF